MSVNLINTLAQPLKSAAKFVAYQEQSSGLSTSRCIMDTATCLGPKAICSRSKEDLFENSALEISENALVYYGPALVGEKIARKVFSKNLSNEAKSLVSTQAKELLESKNPLNKKVIPVKAAIALTALLIPFTEFTLNYFKNLATLKVFKKADFNNIASLEHKKEDKTIQDKVQKSAYKNIMKAVGAFLTALSVAGLVYKKGESSKFLMGLSEAILAPGTKFFKNNQKLKNLFNKYASIDFAKGENGSLVLSKGQLTSCVVIGGAGYFGASKDRGKQNFLETLFRFPLVGFYIITGSELFEKGFKKVLKKLNMCKETISKDLNTPSFDEISKLAQKMAQKNGSNVKDEFKKLAKQKVLIFGVPFIFSIGFMGFFVAATSNLFTKYRFNQDKKRNELSEKYVNQKNESPAFKAFLK